MLPELRYRSLLVTRSVGFFLGHLPFSGEMTHHWRDAAQDATKGASRASDPGRKLEGSLERRMHVVKLPASDSRTRDYRAAANPGSLKTWFRKADTPEFHQA